MFKFGKKVNKKVEELVRLLPKKGRVLDLGCGGGGNSIFLANQGFDVTLVDKDKEVITALKENYLNINAINTDILSFDFRKEEYDLILALNVLHFFNLKDIELIINNILKSLKKDGLLYLQVFSVKDPSHSKFLEIAQRKGSKNTFYSKKMRGFMHFFDKQELLDLFSENKIEEIEEFSKKDNHPPHGQHEHSVIRMLVKKH